MNELTKRMTSDSRDSMKGRFLTFQIAEETFGIEIEHVLEILGVQPVTEVPEMPNYIKGIINLRGSIIPAMDVRLRFRKPEIGYTDRTCVIVISLLGSSIGLIVDRVSEVLTIPDESIAEKPEFSVSGGRGYIKNIGKVDGHLILLIDCAWLLKEEGAGQVPEQL